jgi:hypothetical protein
MYNLHHLSSICATDILVANRSPKKWYFQTCISYFHRIYAKCLPSIKILKRKNRLKIKVLLKSTHQLPSKSEYDNKSKMTVFI